MRLLNIFLLLLIVGKPAHANNFFSEKGIGKNVAAVKKCNDAYRYGFNGQMKTNEIAGLGNHTTAMFWEYDTRTGRRWNLDPINKTSISLYSTLGNSPVWRADPKGDDDYKVTKKGDISLDKTTDDKTDRLISANRKGNLEYNKKGALLSPSISGIDKGILSSKIDYSIKSGDDANGWRLDFGNKTKQAEGVFDFLADHTDVEYSRVTYGTKADVNTNKSSIYTSFQDGSEKLGMSVVRRLSIGDVTRSFNIQHIHNHPGDGVLMPSDNKHTIDGGNGDMELYQSIWKDNPDVRFFLRAKQQEIEIFH